MELTIGLEQLINVGNVDSLFQLRNKSFVNPKIAKGGASIFPKMYLLKRG